MKTQKHHGGKTRLVKKKILAAKKAQVDMFPSFRQLYKYRSIFPREIMLFLQKYKKEYSNTLSQEDIEEMEEEGGYWENEETKQEYIDFHKNSLRLFQAMGRDSADSDYQVDEKNILDMDQAMTDDYLDFLLESHHQDLKQFTNAKSDGGIEYRKEKLYLSESYNNFNKLRELPRLFLLYWSGKSTAKIGLARKLPEDMTKMIDSYVAKNEKYESLFRNNSQTKRSTSINKSKSK